MPEPSRRVRSARALVLGASGQVGGAFSRALSGRGHSVMGTYHSHPRPGLVACDLARPGALDAFETPDLVVLASAMTHVDRCELEPELAERENVGNARRVAEWCAA